MVQDAGQTASAGRFFLQTSLDTAASFFAEPIAGVANSELLASIRYVLAGKTMPAGALGALLPLAEQIALIQSSLQPRCDEAAIIVFAADHGIADRGVSAYPKSVTWQMVANFLAGGAAINVLARSNQIALRIVDAGVDHDFALTNTASGQAPRCANADPQVLGLIDAKIARGTSDFSQQVAMSRAQAELAITRGTQICAATIATTQCQVIAFGEMGIGNTSSAAALTSRLLNLPLAQCVGRGTGIDDVTLARKSELLRTALHRHRNARDPVDILAALGGFEIAMIVGALLTAAQRRCVIVIDGYIVTSALLIAMRLQPALRDYCVFAHQSHEPGHVHALRSIDAQPLLNLGLRLGEGTGAALALPLLRNACAIMRDMASFESAGVAR
jgi:nicotinate-nucleotide--dimethylbenzimidazole phosphoribosyltransferase